MKIVIVYAGNSGTTEKAAGVLKRKLKGAELVDLSVKDPDVSGAGLVVIGSNVRFGRLHKKVRGFVTKNRGVLLGKKVAYFVCCGFPEKQEEYFKESIPKELLDKAVIRDSFGGELNAEKQKGFDKLIIKMVNKATGGKQEVKLLSDKIDDFAEVLKKQ